MERLPRTDLRHGDGRRFFIYGEYDGGELPASAPDRALPALHLRHDALTDRWVAISPARNTRPQSRPAPGGSTARCPLCVGGPELPFGYEAAVFENRFPTLLSAPPDPPGLPGPTAPARGYCEVVLYTPSHEGSLATLSSLELARVIAIWADRSAELWADPMVRSVLVFENRGEDVGATLSHPHGQIYAFDHAPANIRERVDVLTCHRREADRCLTCEVVDGDRSAPERLVVANDSFTVVVPFAPDWPYEVHVRAIRHGTRRLPDLTPIERRDLALALRSVVERYDSLYPEAPLAYLMVCQQAPADLTGSPVDDWHLSFEFLPPARAPGKTKVRASVETAAGMFINDTVPEASAAELASVACSADQVERASIPDVAVVPGEPTDPDEPSVPPTRGSVRAEPGQ